MRNWLITGGCGFIGTSLIRVLKESDDNVVTVLDNLSVGSSADLENVTKYVDCSIHDSPSTSNASNTFCYLVTGDILNAELVAQLARDADVIVHLAANTGVGPSIDDPRSDCNTNVIGTLNVLEGARMSPRKPRVIFASSGAPLGEVERPPIHEELVAKPVSPYGASKLAGEGYCSAYFHSFNVQTVALRFGNVYGPGSAHKSSVVAKFIALAMKGEPLEVYGDGLQTRDFIFIEDLTSAIMRAASASDVGGEIYQIATNRESTLNEMLSLLVDILKNAGIRTIEYSHGAPLVGDVRRNFSDITKAKVQLDWSPNVELPEGLERTVSYFRQLRKPS